MTRHAWVLAALCAGCGFDYDVLRRARDAGEPADAATIADVAAPADGARPADAPAAVDAPADQASPPDGPAPADGPAVPDLAIAAPDTAVAADLAAPPDLAAAPDRTPDLPGPPSREQMYGCPADDELRACYTFDDPGTTLVDRSRHENHGVRHLAAVTAGVSGGSALHFTDGKQYAYVPDRPALRVSGSEATFEAWIRPDRATPADMAADVLAAKWTAAYTGFSFATYDNAVRIYTGGTTARGAGAWTPGVWSHAAVVLSASGVTIYLNGRRAHPDPLPPLSIPTNNEILTIGNINAAIAQVSSSYSAFYGAIDVLRIYGRARSAEEICGDAGGTWSAGQCQPR